MVRDSSKSALSIFFLFRFLNNNSLYFNTGPREEAEATFILPGVNISQLAEFVDHLYAEFNGESIPKEELLKTCQDIENCDHQNCDLKLELNFDDETEDFDNAGLDDYDDEEEEEDNDLKNEDSENENEDENEDTESDTSILAYKFAMMISSGEVEKLAEEEFLSKRSIFPTFIDIDKKAICDALANLKVHFLDDEYRSSQLIGKRKYKISCSLCPYKKNQRSLIMKHLRVHFKMFFCNPCSKPVTAVNNHIRTKHSDKPDTAWVCDVCNKSVKTEYNLTLHKKSHDKVYCDKCDFNCEGRKKLQSHVYRKHAEAKKDPHICHVCSKSVSTSQQLKSHLQIHGDEEFQCEHCQKMFKVEKNMQKHIIMHHKEKKFICERCGKSFSVKCHHDKHVLLKHTKNKNFNCDYQGENGSCDYRGATKYYLQKHMEIHAEAKLTCTHCGKAFRQPGALKSHTMTHTGERPYACTDCTYRCIQPYDLRKHFLKQHNKVIEKPGLYLSTNNSDKKE